MSSFQTNHITATNLQQGDHNTFHADGSEPSVAALAERVEASAAGIREIEAALAELREELARRPPRRERVRELLGTLTTGAGTVTALVEGVDQVRQALGLPQ